MAKTNFLRAIKFFIMRLKIPIALKKYCKRFFSWLLKFLRWAWIFIGLFVFTYGAYFKLYNTSPVDLSLADFYYYVVGVFLVFISSVHLIFRRRSEFHVLPSLLKMFSCIAITIFLYADAYKNIGIVNNGKVSHSPTEALYFSIITWTTTGYGDFIPLEKGRLLASTEALLGYLYMAMLMGVLFHLLSSKNDNNGRE